MQTELFPATTALLYGRTGLMIFASVLIVSILWFWLTHRHRQPKAKPVVAPTKPSPRTKLTKAATLSYIKKLEDSLQPPKKTDLASVYVSLSFILRRYLDDTQGTSSVTMDEGEVQQLKVSKLFKRIINECYQAEFSGDRGSTEQCLAVIKEAREFVQS